MKTYSFQTGSGLCLNDRYYVIEACGHRTITLQDIETKECTVESRADLFHAFQSGALLFDDLLADADAQPVVLKGLSDYNERDRRDVALKRALLNRLCPNGTRASLRHFSSSAKPVTSAMCWDRRATVSIDSQHSGEVLAGGTICRATQTKPAPTRSHTSALAGPTIRYRTTRGRFVPRAAPARTRPCAAAIRCSMCVRDLAGWEGGLPVAAGNGGTAATGQWLDGCPSARPTTFANIGPWTPPR